MSDESDHEYIIVTVNADLPDAHKELARRVREKESEGFEAIGTGSLEAPRDSDFPVLTQKMVRRKQSSGN